MTLKLKCGFGLFQVGRRIVDVFFVYHFGFTLTLIIFKTYAGR